MQLFLNICKFLMCEKLQVALLNGDSLSKLVVDSVVYETEIILIIKK